MISALDTVCGVGGISLGKMEKRRSLPVHFQE